MAALSLLEALALVPDPRKPRGLRHPLPAVLALTVVALLAGMKSLEAIAQFGRDHGPALAHALGFRRGKTPTKSTLSELFRLLDLDAFEAALQTWLLGRIEHGWPAIALDGKTLRGSRAGEIPGVHLLAAYVPAATAVLGQMRVDGKTKEHKAVLRFLGVLPLRDKVVTGDAMFTHRDVAEAIRAHGGDYVLIVKDNQPELRASIQAALHDDDAFSPLSASTEREGRAAGGNGRQKAWPQGVPAADEHDGAERLSGLASGGAGL